MMKSFRQIIYLVTGICLGVSMAFSNSHNVVKLKDGTTLKGDIIVQRPGKDITVRVEEGTFVIPEKGVKSKQTYKTAYENLPREWQRWSLENNALKGDAYGRYLILEDVNTEKYSLQKVVKTGQARNGQDSSKPLYIQMVPSVYKIKWGDVEEIKKLPVKVGSKDGLDDEVTTFSGRKYVGKIVSQHPGKDMTIRTNNGLETVNSTEIKEIKKLAKKEMTSWRGETDYNNVIVDNSGESKRGLILTHHFGKAGADNYIELLTEKNRKEKIEVAKIEEYQTQYDQPKESLYKEGEVYVNEFIIAPAKVKEFNGTKGYIDDKVYPFPEGIITTFKTQGGKFQGPWTLIALEDVELDGGKRTKGYDKKIKESNSIRASSTDMAEGISSLTFVYLSPGYYALTNGDETESYVIKIVK